MDHTGINRRAALRSLAAGTAGVAASTLWVEHLTALTQDHAAHYQASAAVQPAGDFTPKALTRRQLDTVATLSDLIIPTTDTPGARAVLVDRFIDGALVDASAADRQKFLDGLAWIDARSTALFARPFTDLTPARQADLLTRLSTENSTEEPAGVMFFEAIKSMTIAGYYTTRVGLRDELGDDGVLFLPVYVGCTHPEHQA